MKHPGLGIIHIGPSDYVPWQNDNKVCIVRMEGRGLRQRILCSQPYLA